MGMADRTETTHAVRITRRMPLGPRSATAYEGPTRVEPGPPSTSAAIGFSEQMSRFPSIHTRCLPAVRAVTVIIRHRSHSDEAGGIVSRSAPTVVNGSLDLEHAAFIVRRDTIDPRVFVGNHGTLHGGPVE